MLDKLKKRSTADSQIERRNEQEEEDSGALVEMGDRTAMTQFWSQYASAPTVETMMLHNEAQIWDESDRMDVIAGLPDNITEMDVVELGAGIGRFTKHFAQKARTVLATDFIESFIKKNEELHQHYGNTVFKVGDAVNQQLDNNSCDLLFTNWLLMYLTDAEVAQFCLNAIKWIRPQGYLHIRESCTEPSTKAPKKLVGNENPTYYRHCSLYMNVFSKLLYVDPESGQRFQFQIQWAKSIPTYVDVKANWRQVHMVLKKVPIAASAAPQENAVVDATSIFKELHRTNVAQLDLETNWMQLLKVSFDRFSPLERLITEALDKHDQTISGLLNLNATMINSLNIAKQLNCCVEGLVEDAVEFSALLGMANAKSDRRVRFQWTDFALDNWKIGDAQFDAAIGIDLIERVPSASRFLRTFRKCLKDDAIVILFESQLLEPRNGLLTLNKYGFELISFHCHDADAIDTEQQQFIDHLNPLENQQMFANWKKWMSCPKWTQFQLKAIPIV